MLLNNKNLMILTMLMLRTKSECSLKRKNNKMKCLNARSVKLNLRKTKRDTKKLMLMKNITNLISN